MIDYGCPHCGRKAFESASVIPVLVRWKCKDHGIVDVVPRHSPQGVPAQRTYSCSQCQRTQHVEAPKNARSYCVTCGTQTLVIVAEIGAINVPGPRSRGMNRRPTEAREHARNE